MLKEQAVNTTKDNIEHLKYQIKNIQATFKFYQDVYNKLVSQEQALKIELNNIPAEDTKAYDELFPFYMEKHNLVLLAKQIMDKTTDELDATEAQLRLALIDNDNH